MQSTSLPVPLAKVLVNLIPARVLDRSVELVLRRMKTRHPKLFKNLAALQPALVVLDPTDLPHSFALEIGVDPVSFYLIQGATPQPAAKVSGSLQAMIDMLEGRADGDMLFFSRDIQITGDTSVIVALRNTLDREEIDLFHEITSLCGPFAQPARLALTIADRLARRVKERIGQLHNDLHEQEGKATP